MNPSKWINEGGVFFELPENLRNIKSPYIMTVKTIRPDGKSSIGRYYITASGRKEAAKLAIERAKGHITTMDMNLYKYEVIDAEFRG